MRCSTSVAKAASTSLSLLAFNPRKLFANRAAESCMSFDDFGFSILWIHQGSDHGPVELPSAASPAALTNSKCIVK